MSERIDDDSVLHDEPANSELWHKLEGLNQLEPSAGLRQRVLTDLNGASRPSQPWWRVWLPAQPAQWVGLAATMVLGVAIGLLLFPPDSQLDQRMAQLESQLSAVNQQLLMSRLTAAAPSERLSAALQASTLVQRDPQIANALLQRAALDAVPSVRSAAIGALGGEINEEQTAAHLLDLLTASESPIVQMAIIDLILRHGEAALLARLKQRVGDGELHPALAGYVEDTMGGLEI